MKSRHRGVAVAALVVLAACSSNGSADNPTSPTTVPAITSSPTSSASPATTLPATTTPSTVAPTTAAATTSAPAAPAPGSRPAWEATFESMAQAAGNTVVDTDNPGGLGVGHPGQWLLVDTTTDRTVAAAIDAPVIGVRPAPGNTFAVVTVRPDGSAEVLAVAADGSVDSLGSFPVDSASPPDGRLPTAAAIGVAGDTLYVAAGVPRQAGFPFTAALARVQNGATTPLADPPGYGPITFTDAGALVITVPSDGRVAGPAENRWISADRGATWRSISIPPGDFPSVHILLGISETSAVASDGNDPTKLGVAHADGSVSGGDHRRRGVRRLARRRARRVPRPPRWWARCPASARSSTGPAGRRWVPSGVCSPTTTARSPPPGRAATERSTRWPWLPTVRVNAVRR